MVPDGRRQRRVLASATTLLTLQRLDVVGRAATDSGAVDAAAATRPDVSLVDGELGPEDGVELTTRLVRDGTLGTSS